MIITPPKYLLFGLLLILNSELVAISLVYNMKIRRAFALGASGGIRGDEESEWIASLLPIYYQRKRQIVQPQFQTDVYDQHKTTGVLLNLRYSPAKRWWAELSTGLEHESLVNTGTFTANLSKTGWDDIALFAGHNVFISDQTQFVLYGVGGVPTERKISALEKYDTLVGTRFFSVGVGTELSHDFIGTLERSLIGIFQNRLLHFFSREWQPILSAGSVIQPGNVTDLLWALRYRKWRNLYELGYNLTLFTNQAVRLHPGGYLPADNVYRNSAYVSFAHVCSKFPGTSHPVVLGLTAYGSVSKQYHTRILAVIGSLNIVF
ncbi:MAG TPA: hypothetical protein VJJ83_03615 [Candidatus Babeliales bacterium]|nr:hypothetical protein [Candidatus Babeliales bacterium]